MGEKKLHYKMYKDGKKFVFAAIATLSFFVFGGVSTVAVHADTTSVNLTAATVNSTSDTKSAVSSAATVASSSSATKANSTSASSSSAVKTETTSASSSSATKADSTSASSSSAVKTETTSASSSIATKADSANATSTNEYSASASKLSKTGAASTSNSTAVKTNAKYANSVETVDNNKRGNRENTHSINQRRIVKRSAVVPSTGKITINRDNFKDFFNQNGSAKDNYDQLTGIQTITNGSFQSGNISFDGSIDVRHNFEIDGAINLGQITSNYGYTGIADGIGFVFYKGERNQVGGNGGDLGIYGVTNAFGWKVDTWFNDSDHTNSGQKLKGDYDDGHHNPYGAFITTNKTGYGSIDQQSAKNLTKSIEDNKFHGVKFIYTANTKEFKIVLSTPDGDVPFSKTFDYDETSPAYYFTIAASTGILPTNQAFRIDSMTYSPIQKAIINYVDDTTGRTIASDSVTGNSEETIDYSTANKISGFQKNGYELVKDGFSKGATYDDDDTVDQLFDVHLTHGTTPVGPNNPQTPGAPINPDEPNGPKWPISTNYDKTVNETVSYVDQNGHVVAKQHTDSVNFTRTVVVDNVTGEVITSGAGTTAWTATNGDTTFDAVVSPVVSGSVANKAQTAAVTDLNADSADVNETVTYTKVGSLVPSSSDGNFPGAPTVVYPNDPSDATKVTPAGVPTVPGYTAHDPEGHVLTPGSSYQPSDPTKDTTITYTADKQKGSVSYVDDTTGKTLKTDSISGTTGSKSSYSTSGSIADYKKHGYELVTDGYPADLTFDNDDTTDQNFTVHLKHQLTPVNPTDPQTPGAPINPDEPDGPKWPEGTDKSSVTQTVIRTVNYLDKQTGKVVAKQVTEQVTYNRTAIVDKVTGQIIGYSTTGGDTVDQTDGDKAWTAVDNKSDWDSVTSPDLSSKGYLAPDLATVAQQTVTPGDKDVTVNVYYDHDVVPVNPTNPQTPGTPINPDDPDSPKWPAGTDKNSLTTDVHQTIHYQYGDGSQAAPDKTDSTTFDHQVEIDKVTGEIVKDDGWTAENGKTSFDSKNSPVIPGYTASKPASDPVDGLTQDSKDNVQTIVYAKTPVAGGNVTAKYVDENGNPIADDVIASGNVGNPYSTTQKDVPGYTFKEVQGNPTGSFTDQDQTVTYVYTKNPATDNNGGTGPNQPGKPGNGTDTGNPSSKQPGNPSQPSNATNNGVINTSTNTGSKVNNGAVNSPELPQTGENNSQSQTMSFIGILLAMFGSLLGFLGIKKRRND